MEMLHTPNNDSREKNKLHRFSFLMRLLAFSIIFVAPLTQPVLALTLSPLIAGIYLSALLWKKGFLKSLSGLLFGISAVPIYTGLTLNYLSPILYRVTVPLWSYAPVVGFVFMGVLVSLSIFKTSKRETRDHIKVHSAIWLLVPALAGVYWWTVYTFILPGVGKVGEFIVGAVWQSWVVVAFVFLLAACTFAVWHYTTRRFGRAIRFDAFAWVLVSALAAFVWHTNHDEQIVSWQWARSVNPEYISELPESADADLQRILPRATAYNYILDATNSQLELRASDPHMVRHGDKLMWQSHFHVDNKWGQMCDSIKQVIQVDAATTRKQPHIENQTSFPHVLFVCSSESWVFQGAFKFRHPFSTQGNNIYWKYPDGHWVALMPYTSMRPTDWGTMVPYLAGVDELSQWGVVTSHSVSDAVKLFPGAQFFPPELARTLAQKYGDWHGGFLGRGLTEVGQLEVSEDSATAQIPAPVQASDYRIRMLANQAPYIQQFKELSDLQEVIAFEPIGKNNFGLVELAFIDAGTGHWRVWKNPESEQKQRDRMLSGPRNAKDYIRSGDPDVGNWEHSLPVDPKLIIKKDRGIFYLWGVVTYKSPNARDGTYVLSAIIDGYTLSPWRVMTREAIDEFLSLPSNPSSNDPRFRIGRPGTFPLTPPAPATNP